MRIAAVGSRSDIFLKGGVGNDARVLGSVAFDGVVQSIALPVFSIAFQRVGSISQAQRHEQRDTALRRRKATEHDSKPNKEDTKK